MAFAVVVADSQADSHAHACIRAAAGAAHARTDTEVVAERGAAADRRSRPSQLAVTEAFGVSGAQTHAIADADTRGHSAADTDCG